MRLVGFDLKKKFISSFPPPLELDNFSLVRGNIGHSLIGGNKNRSLLSEYKCKECGTLIILSRQVRKDRICTNCKGVISHEKELSSYFRKTDWVLEKEFYEKRVENDGKRWYSLLKNTKCGHYRVVSLKKILYKIRNTKDYLLTECQECRENDLLESLRRLNMKMIGRKGQFIRVRCGECGEERTAQVSDIRSGRCLCLKRDCNRPLTWEGRIVRLLEHFFPSLEVRRNVVFTWLADERWHKTCAEIDIFLPSLNIGIESNDYSSHRGSYKTIGDYRRAPTKQYHNSKTKKCRKNGLILYHFFEPNSRFNTGRDVVKFFQNLLTHIRNNGETLKRGLSLSPSEILRFLNLLNTSENKKDNYEIS